MPRIGLFAASLAWLIASRRAASLMAAPSCCRGRDRRPIASPNRAGRRRCGLAAAPPPSRTISITARCAHRAGIAADRNGHKVSIQHQSVENVEPMAADAPTITPGLDVPRHVAFICDGNSRWAHERGLPESMGHAAGADRVVQLIKALHRRRSAALNANEDTQSTRQGANNGERPRQRRIEYCTLFAFSTENWSRPRSEINALFKLMERTAGQYRNFDAVREGKVQITVLGDLDDDRIPDGARRELRALERESKDACSRRKEGAGDDDNGFLTVCLAINYGGRADILRAAGELAKSIASGELPPDAIHDELELSKRLRTSSIPDPDLIVRTGGERRLSNFLLWDAAYAELYFSDALWPDFDEGALEEALDWYGTRKRRFGGR